MRKELIVLTIFLVAATAAPPDVGCATAKADGLNVWLGADSDSVSTQPERSLTARVGYRFGAGDPYEVGVAAIWLPSSEVRVPQTWTIYGLYQVGLPVIIENPLPLEWLPKTFQAQSYIGAQVGLDFYNNGVITGPVAGLVIEKILVVEYQYQYFTERLANDLRDNEHKLFFGLKIVIP